MPTATVNIPSPVLNYANLVAFPLSGALKTIYIAEDSNLEYRWTGSAYQLLGAAGSSVQSVTGDGVDNTDPLNPVLTFPTPTEIGLGNVNNTSDANKPISTATQTVLDLKVDENAAITGSTKTKITYDAKGLVTSGTDAALADLTDDATHRVVTDSQIATWNALIGGSIFQTTWNATTNSPALVSSTGTKGYYYIVSTAGSTNLDGITDWKIGDWAIYDGSVWRKVDNTDAVSSVNGFTGAVSLDTSNVPDTSNKRYVTDAQLVVIGNTSGTNTGNETTSTLGATINGAASGTPNDTDLVVSVESSVVKKNTWTQIKAFLKTYFDTIYQASGTYLTSSNIKQTITNGVTTNAPSEDAVFDALALKANLASPTFTGTPAAPTAGNGTSTTQVATTAYVIDARPVARFYSDTSTNTPGDGGIFYYSTVNNYVVETSNTYRIIAPKTNGIFHVTVVAFVRGTLATTETSTVKIQNITLATEETLTNLTHDKRVNASHSVSTLAMTAGNEITIQCTNPSWVTNPTIVHYQFIIEVF